MIFGRRIEISKPCVLPDFERKTMTEFEAKSVIDAINRMFKKGHFSICTVDDCMRVTGAVETSDYNAMRLYHCVNYSAMDKETKAFLFKATMENVCNVDDFPEIKMAKRSEEIQSSFVVEQQPTLLKRLFGSGAK